MYGLVAKGSFINNVENLYMRNKFPLQLKIICRSDRNSLHCSMMILTSPNQLARCRLSKRRDPLYVRVLLSLLFSKLQVEHRYQLSYHNGVSYPFYGFYDNAIRPLIRKSFVNPYFVKEKLKERSSVTPLLYNQIQYMRTCKK